MKFSIKPLGEEPSLCHSCEDSHITEDGRGRQTVICNYYHPSLRIYAPVKKCNKYTRIGSMQLHDMQKVAWILEVEAKTVVGFRAPKKRDDD